MSPRQTIENYPIPVTIVTIVIVCASLFGTAYKIGADQTKVEKDVIQLEEQAKDCKAEMTKQKEINNTFSGFIIEIRQDIKHIRGAVEDLKDEKKKRGRDDQ